GNASLVRPSYQWPCSVILPGRAPSSKGRPRGGVEGRRLAGQCPRAIPGQFGETALYAGHRGAVRSPGTWVENFYVRGLSLSAPSWSLLDTGRRLELRGNVEYDRYTLRPYDYLNFFPAYVDTARSRRVDMPGVELLDELGIPLLVDRFRYPDRF